jgi:hypothetical protein
VSYEVPVFISGLSRGISASHLNSQEASGSRISAVSCFHLGKCKVTVLIITNNWPTSAYVSVVVLSSLFTRLDRPTERPLNIPDSPRTDVKRDKSYRAQQLAREALLFRLSKVFYEHMWS